MDPEEDNSSWLETSFVSVEDNITFDGTVCGNLTEDYKTVWKQYEFWCEGVLFSCLGMFGLATNIASILTLLSRDMRGQTFNQLLAALAVTDILYIIFNVPVHANATLETVSNWFSVSSFLSQAYVYVLYPMSAVTFCASIYMTLAVTVERYIAVCRPHQYRTISQTMTNTKRLMVYVIPVTVLSFALNIPKFMEVTVTQTNGTNEVDPSQTRRDPTFIFWYTLSLIWHPTLTTGVLPFLGLVYMNLNIFLGIQKTRKILSGRQSKQRQSEANLAITLISIVFMHILCNTLRVILGVLVVALVDEQVSCVKHFDQYIPPLWIMCLESVAHLLVMLNFSSNFLIYCSVSSQFKTQLSKVARVCLKRDKKQREDDLDCRTEVTNCGTTRVQLENIEKEASNVQAVNHCTVHNGHTDKILMDKKTNTKQSNSESISKL